MLELRRPMVILINAAIALFLIALVAAFVVAAVGKILIIAGGVLLALVVGFYVVIIAADPKGFAAGMRRANEQQKLKDAHRLASKQRAEAEWRSRPR